MRAAIGSQPMSSTTGAATVKTNPTDAIEPAHTAAVLWSRRVAITSNASGPHRMQSPAQEGYDK